MGSHEFMKFNEPNLGVMPNKKIPVFRVLNLQVKPRIFFRFSGKNIILCILKGISPFKMHKIIFFPEKKIIKKNKCVPALPKIFRSITRNTLNFLFGIIQPAQASTWDFGIYEKGSHNSPIILSLVR